MEAFPKPKSSRGRASRGGGRGRGSGGTGRGRGAAGPSSGAESRRAREAVDALGSNHERYGDRGSSSGGSEVSDVDGGVDFEAAAAAAVASHALDGEAVDGEYGAATLRELTVDFSDLAATLGSVPLSVRLGSGELVRRVLCPGGVEDVQEFLRGGLTTADVVPLDDDDIVASADALNISGGENDDDFDAWLDGA